MLERSGSAKAGIAKRKDAHAVLLNALADKENSYRRWMRPADIIAQNINERPKPKPFVSPGRTAVLWQYLCGEFKRRTAAELPLLRLFGAVRTRIEALFHSQELRNRGLHRQEH